ncbi:squalene synthase HpnC [Hydrogenophaga sp. 5NK40-0174]|uniref:squalene synthase HpnC n=1 Tax=Hydrogenophaga sp. 5NK40-0174 TaxID=3127649 RepID=UPI003102154B
MRETLEPQLEAATPDADPVGILTSGVGHYENFPVASLLSPPYLRPAIKALYRFARTADDMADEGKIAATTRLEALSQYRRALDQCMGRSTYQGSAWPQVFGPLAGIIQRYRLPEQPLHDLISAFEQDVRYTAAQRIYRNEAELLRYCELSANPVGRLLLHLYGVTDTASIAESDQICSALQLINFWQDVREDAQQGRFYLPIPAFAHAGLDPKDLLAVQAGSVQGARLSEAILALARQARSRMESGSPLALRLPGRAGLELRLVVHGGLRILDHIEAMAGQTWAQRPRLKAMDYPVMAWRVMRYRHWAGQVTNP